MKIRAIKPKRGEFAGEGPIEFHPGVNVIRGPNGIGKTTILEYASLLGHVAAMRPAAVPMSGSSVGLLISLSPCDKRFLRGLKDSETLDEALIEFDRALKTIGSSVKSLKAATIPDGEFELGFAYNLPDVNDSLKDVLATEKRIREEVRVHGDADQIRLVQALNLWSRPISIGPDEPPEAAVWSVTPRFRRVCRPNPTAPQPSPVFYVNTDMYEFGTGLDIRESPKHLKEKITPIMVDRLQLVTCDHLPSDGKNLSDGFSVGEKGYLICEEELRKSWGKVFVNYHKFEEGYLTCTTAGDGSGSEKRVLSWRFKVRGEARSAFLSSGENQALFVLAMLHGLVTEGSCMLLDEPELHLTFRAGSLLMKRTLERAKQTQSQAIIVTHLPHLYRSAISANRKPWEDEENYPYESIRMIHIGGEDPEEFITYDDEAVDCAARFAHADVITLVDGLHVPEVRVWPPLEEWKTWLSLFRRRKKETGAPSPPSNP